MAIQPSLVWNVSVITRLLRPPKWFRTDRDLKSNVVVYFRKVETEFDTPWTVGHVDSLERGKDNVSGGC